MSKAERTPTEAEIEIELDPETRLEKAVLLAQKMSAHKDLEELAKEKKKQIKLMLDNSASEIEELREAVETGKAKSTQTVYEEADFKKGLVKVYDAKGKFLHDRKMTDEERQTHIKGIEPSLANKPDGNPVADVRKSAARRAAEDLLNDEKPDDKA